jgi:hypothetical protein
MRAAQGCNRRLTPFGLLPICFLDDDPVVLAHGRAILEENDLTHLVDADLTRPDDVLGHEMVKKYLDPDLPVALIQSRTLHHVPGALRPQEIVRRYLELLPSGSYLALSHSSMDDQISEEARERNAGCGFVRLSRPVAEHVLHRNREHLVIPDRAGALPPREAGDHPDEGAVSSEHRASAEAGVRGALPHGQCHGMGELSAPGRLEFEHFADE